ncbi:MAG TPA: DNA recombination protein RmuC [Solirubrobacteraceae bacterium]
MDSILIDWRSSADTADMGLLISYILGAASATVLIVVVLQRRSDGDPALADSLGELRGLLTGVSRQQEKLVSEATQWNQLLGHAGERGHWGELTLQNLVEAAGLREHVDFDVQVHVSDGEQEGRPDLVLRLPAGGSLPVDSKAIWSAYQDSLGVDDPSVREALLSKHARNVRSCVQTLAQKAYWSQFARAPEMVVLFMPSEAAFAAAAAHDPDLLAYAVQQRVAITTPSTLFALLQVVAVGWHQAELSTNAEEIRKLGSQLVKRLAGVTEQLAKASRGLDSAVRAHNEVIGCFEGTLLNTARRMGDLGVAGGSELASPQLAAVSVRMPHNGNVDNTFSTPS